MLFSFGIIMSHVDFISQHLMRRTLASEIAHTISHVVSLTRVFNSRPGKASRCILFDFIILCLETNLSPPAANWTGYTPKQHHQVSSYTITVLLWSVKVFWESSPNRLDSQTLCTLSDQSLTHRLPQIQRPKNCINPRGIQSMCGLRGTHCLFFSAGLIKLTLCHI